MIEIFKTSKNVILNIDEYFNTVELGVLNFKEGVNNYLEGNLTEFEDVEILPFEELPELERWVLHRLTEVDEKVRSGFDDYNYHRVYNALYNFCSVDLSAFYFDASWD